MDTAISSKIKALDPDVAYREIVRLTLEDRFIWDFQRSLELGLFRTFSVPSIARLLHKTGEFEKNGQKRYDDTVLLLINILQHGYEEAPGSQFLNRMNKTHAHYQISNDDYLFTLSTFVIDPIDWIERFGWRPLMSKEKVALFNVWRQIGVRMGIHSIPASLDDMRRWSEQFVEEQFTYSQANAQVAKATLGIVKSWLTDWLAGFVEPVTSTLLDDRTRRSLGLKPPPAWARTMIPALLRMRGRLMRLGLMGHQQKVPDGKRSYPDGYSADELAPARLLNAEKKPHTVRANNT